MGGRLTPLSGHPQLKASMEANDRPSRLASPGGRAVALRLAAEFAVIVIGVLVALGLEEVREDREEQRIVAEALGDIATQIQDTHFTFGVIHASVMPEKMAALERLVGFFREENAPLQDTLLLVEDLRLAMVAGILWLESDRYEALRSSGMLRLVRDPEIAEVLAGAYAAPDVLFGQADRIRSGFAHAATQILPIELAPSRNHMAGYARDFDVPEFAAPPDLEGFVRELRRRRLELLPLARAEVWTTSARWVAIGRLRRSMAIALDALEPWNPNPWPADAEFGQGLSDPTDPNSRRFAPDSTPAGYAEGRFTGVVELFSAGSS